MPCPFGYTADDDDVEDEIMDEVEGEEEEEEEEGGSEVKAKETKPKVKIVSLTE